MRQMPFWVDSAPAIPSYAGRTLPDEVDVAIVGGGYTGLSTALHLAKKGARVAVLEQETLGWGASSRNGGHCNTGITIGPSDAVKRYGEDAARRLYQMSHDAVSCVEEIVRGESIDCDFVRNGRLGLASKPAHFGRLRARKEALARYFGSEQQLISRDELRREIGSNVFHGALLDPLSAALQPAKLAFGMAEAAVRHGAEMYEGTRVTGIERRDSSRFMVRTARGNLSAGQVLVATNGYTDRAAPALKQRILPIGSFVIATEPLSDDLASEISPQRRNMVTSKNFSNYFRLSADNRLIFGGRARFALSNPESDRECAEILQRDMATVFPQLANVAVDYIWGGIVCFTLDRMPHAGEMDGMHYALGYCGHGVQIATYMGKCMAEVLDGHPEANPLRDIPFPRVPYAFGWTWILPLAGLYYQMKDRVS
jgi:glycine/D-amino acid oxidase-like deaminating enzyme